MNIPFVKMSPGGNTTILLHMVAPDMVTRAQIAKRVMDSLHLGGEQVGFMDMSCHLPRLEMMGGEFCGNAARSFAALLAMDNHTALQNSANSDVFDGEISVSGVSGSVRVRVVKRQDEVALSLRAGAVRVLVYDASVCLALPSRPDTFMEFVEPGIDIVRLEGITHILLDTTLHHMPAEPAYACELLRKRLELLQADAVGCIWYTRKAEGLRIDPMVWVRETASTHYETGCGSGSLALGLLEAVRLDRSWEGNVLQPSGQCIRSAISFAKQGELSEAWIGGDVRLIARGDAYLW